MDDDAKTMAWIDLFTRLLDALQDFQTRVDDSRLAAEEVIERCRRILSQCETSLDHQEHPSGDVSRDAVMKGLLTSLLFLGRFTLSSSPTKNVGIAQPSLACSLVCSTSCSQAGCYQPTSPSRLRHCQIARNEKETARKGYHGDARWRNCC